MTSIPWRTSPFITRPTSFSLPGMVREEKITWSPLSSVTVGMLRLGDAGKRGARLPLRPGAQRQHTIARQALIGIKPRKSCTPSR